MNTLKSISPVFALILFSHLANAQLFSTKLEITVLNTTGNYVAGAEVKLFENEDDYLADKNVVQGKKYTDSKGEVLYKDLKEKPYYVSVSKGNADNFGEGVETIPLQSGSKNKVNIVITEGN